MYTGNKLDKGNLILMSQSRQLSLVTSYPYFPSCRYITMYFIFLEIFLGDFFLFFFFFFVNKVIPCNYLSRECGLHKASDLILGDHVCEKSDAVISLAYLVYFRMITFYLLPMLVECGRGSISLQNLSSRNGSV